MNGRGPRPTARAVAVLGLSAVCGLATASDRECAESYPEICISPAPATLGCDEVPHRDFAVSGPDSHGLDADGDGRGCDTDGPVPEWMTPYATQMHLHGHSNHNAGGSPESKVASMQWHAAEAALTGAAEVLWWSDHAHMFDQHATFEFDMQSSVVEAGSLDIVGLSRPLVNGQVARLAASVGGGSAATFVVPADTASGSRTIPRVPSSVRMVDLRALVTLEDWTRGALRRQAIVGALPNRLGLFVRSDGRLEAQATLGDPATLVIVESTAEPPVADGDRSWLRLQLDLSSGLATFFTSSDATADHERVVWSQLGDRVALETSGGLTVGVDRLVLSGGGDSVTTPLVGYLHAAAFVFDGRSWEVDFTSLAGLTSSPPDYSRWGFWSLPDAGWVWSEAPSSDPGVGLKGMALLPHETVFSLAAEPDAAEWQWFSYEAQSAAPSPTVHNVLFARPVSSDAVAEVDLDCESPGADAVCEIELRLAWHSDGEPVHHVVVYRIDSEARVRESALLEPGRLLVVMPQRDDGRYRFELLRDAIELPNGDDNTLNRLFFRVGSRKGSVATMTLRRFRLRSERPERRHQLEAIQGFARRYQDSFAQTHHVGVESGSRLLHMNAFLPEPMSDRDLDLLDNFKSETHIRDWVSAVHDRGGLVSYNHPFHEFMGLQVCGDQQAEECVPALAARMLDSAAWGADLLEVGYLRRGLSLHRHLQLWDILTANGLLLGGTGVSDSHGDHWKWFPHPFVTWLIASSPEPSQLIEAMAARRMFFGNPFLWRGVFTMRMGDRFMGERMPSPGGSSDLRFTLEPWPEDVELHLVQGLLGENLEVEYLHDRTRLTRGSERVAIDTSRPSFVRLEAYRRAPDGGLTPVAFTNPIVMEPISPR